MSVRAHGRRQLPVSNLAAPTGSGIENTAKVVNTDAAAGATGLVTNPDATTSPIITPTPVATPTSSQTSTQTSSTAPSQSMGATAGSSSSIALSTVIGACVGAFIGATAFILLAIFFYRRYSQSLKRQAKRRVDQRSAHNNSRNTRAEQDRRRSRAQAWGQLDSGDMEDKWEGMNSDSGAPVTREVKEMDNLSPGLFKHSPSSAVSHSSAEDSPRAPTFRMDNIYATTTPTRVPEARDLLGREPHNMLGQIDSGPPMSWASDSKSSYLSSTRLSGGAMSPSLTMAIPTPPAVKSQLHRWESAEVVDYSEGQTAEIVDQPRESLHNPFFNATVDYPIHSRSRSNSSHSRSARSRSNSTETIQGNNALSKKDRVVSIDPFRDPLPKPNFIHHLHLPSNSSSSASNDRAIRQLVAAASLEDLSEDEVQRRLRVASMQPSVISNSGDSMYTDAEPDTEEEAMMSSFPVPPNSSSHETASYHNDN